MDDIIVAIGSLNDCELLVEKFSHSESLSFADFAREWKASHFELIFCGRSSVELPVLASELLAIAKAILLNVNKEFASRVGGLYLMYGLYFTQKSKSKIRLTLNEFKELMKFTCKLKEKNIIDAQFIFQKLFIGKAFLFCACSTPNKYTPMDQCQSEEDVDADNFMDIVCHDSLMILDVLQSEYDEKKQTTGYKTTPSFAAPLENFPAEVRTTIETFKTDIDKIKSNGTQQGKPTSDAEEINQGVNRRRTEQKNRRTSFQSQSRSRRMRVDVTSNDSARKSSKTKPGDSGSK